MSKVYEKHLYILLDMTHIFYVLMLTECIVYYRVAKLAEELRIETRNGCSNAFVLSGKLCIMIPWSDGAGNLPEEANQVMRSGI